MHIKFLGSVVILFILATGQLFAQGIGKTAFKIGERLDFSIEFEFIPGGTATMSVEGISEVDGFMCLKLTATARSSSKVDLIYKVRDRIESYRDFTTGFSRKFIKDTREGKHKEDKRVFFKPEKDEIIVHHNVDDPPEIQQFGEGLQDILGAFYQVRNEELVVGRSVWIDVQDVGKRYRLEVEVQGYERVEVPAGTFDCVIVEPLLKSSGIFRKEGSLQIWLTNDGTKMPVLMKSKLPFGAVYGKLTSFSLGN